MIRSTLQQFVLGEISRREFIMALGKIGIGTLAANQFAAAFAASPETKQDIHLKGVTGGQISCETFKLWDVKYVFGNTGAYEAGLVDAMVDYPDIHYVLSLQEGATMAMADGYARVTGKPAVVNVHSITGTANALGMIVNAWADNSPVIVTVGFSANSGENRGVFTETPKVEAIPELFTKLSFRAGNINNLGESLRHAFQLASMLPTGPVFVGVPADVWSGKLAETSLIPAERSLPNTQIHPDPKAIDKAAKALLKAKNPLLVSGAELPRWGGLKELVEISDSLGAAVSGDTSSSRSSMGFPTRHPRYLGAMRQQIQMTEPFDVVLLAGSSRLSLARGGHPLIPLDAEIIELGIREDHLARVYPADQLIYAHPEVTLQRLRDVLKKSSVPANLRRNRDKQARALKEKRTRQLKENLDKVWDSQPIAPERLAFEVDKVINKNALVVTEGVSSDKHIWDYVNFDQVAGGREHLLSSGGSLGWGLGAGIGAKLGRTDRQVVIMLGDGSYQFGIQALWTAKRFEVPFIVIIFNNHAYQANRWAISGLKNRGAETGKYIGINIDNPDIDHVGIARSYGLDGERVTEANELAAALKRATEAEKNGKTYVLDVLIDKRGGGADSDWYEKHLPVFSS